jgi:hypothetical protein
MPALSDVTGRLQYKERIASVTKDLPSDLRNSGVVPALIGLASRFGKNNRALVHGIF